MMRWKTGTFVLAALGGAAAVAAAPDGVRVAALGHVAGGRWEVHEIGRTGAPHSVCITDSMQLLQLRHGARACARFLLASAQDGATVHYTCPGAGHGQTAVTVESPTLLRLQTQGIADGQPFDLDLEARRTGTC